MNTDTPSKEPPMPTGRRYASVSDLMKGEKVIAEVVTKVKELSSSTRLTHQLSVLRHAAGITQEQMATKLGLTQSAVSKLENGLDEHLTVGQIRAYAEITKTRMGVTFGQELNHSESVKMHAFGMKDHLLELAKLANNDGEMEKEINAFFGEVFFNYMHIFSQCAQQMPKNGSGIRLVMFDKPRPASPTPAESKNQGLVTA
jgi:transcriptional regulator with XRE-family HTH domain